jgi:hypothetical protein
MKKFMVGFSVPFALGALVLPVQALQQNLPKTEAAPVLMSQSVDLGAIANDFIGMMATGDFASAYQMYDGIVRQTVGQQSIEQNWQDITAEAGAFQGCSREQTSVLEEPGASAVVRVTCQFDSGSRDLFVVFSDANQIASFSVAE